MCMHNIGNYLPVFIAVIHSSYMPLSTDVINLTFAEYLIAATNCFTALLHIKQFTATSHISYNANVDLSN